MANKGGVKTRKNKNKKKKIIRQDSGNDVDINRGGGGGDGGSDGIAKRIRKKKTVQQRKRERERDERRKKVNDSLGSLGKLPFNRSKLDYKVTIKTNRKRNNESGVTVSSQILKRKQRNSQEEAKKTIRIDSIQLDDSSKLRDTISVLDNTKPEDSLGDIEFNVAGIQDLEQLQLGIQDLDPSISINYVFRDTKDIARKLEDGFEGIKAFMENARDKPENDKIKQIENLVKKLEEDQTNIKGVGKESQLFKALESLVGKAKQENITYSERKFMAALENSINLELRRQREPNQEVRKATFENLKGMLAQDSFKDIKINSQYLSKANDLVSDIAVVAGLTPEDIGKLFNTFDVPNPRGEGNLTFGGQIQKLLKDAFSLENTDEDRKSKIENLESDIRDQMAIALNQLGKNIKAEDLPDSLFTKKYLNTDPPEPIIIPEVGNVDRIVKWVRREKKKGKRVDGDLTELNTDTASDVYTVTTLANIGSSGTNQGYAKIGLKDGDASTKTTNNLRIKTERDSVYDGSPGALIDHPNLIAREVGSSRIDRGLEIGVLSDQVFSSVLSSDGTKENTIGISAKVPGKAIREIVKQEGQRDEEALQMFRNFDYTNPNTQKGLSDLQIMDAITGQLDRHLSNIFIDPKTGKVYGIDNDMAFPKDVNWGEHSTISGLFTGEGKDMKFNQNFIDADTGKKILNMTESQLRKILDGKPGDPETLSKESKDAAVDRFLAVQKKVKELDEDPSALISNWTVDTQRAMLAAGNNLMSRAVEAFQAAGDPNNTTSVQGL